MDRAASPPTRRLRSERRTTHSRRAPGLGGDCVEYPTRGGELPCRLAMSCRVGRGFARPTTPDGGPRKASTHPTRRSRRLVMRAVDVIRRSATGGADPRRDRCVRPRRGRPAWAEYQLSALLMAIYLHGMTAARPRTSPRRWPTPASATSRTSARPEGRQAQHRRRRRQDVADPRPARGRVRGGRADDVRPRARSLRRHARQARIDPRLPRRPDGGRVPRGAEGSGSA